MARIKKQSIIGVFIGFIIISWLWGRSTIQNQGPEHVITDDGPEHVILDDIQIDEEDQVVWVKEYKKGVNYNSKTCKYKREMPTDEHNLKVWRNINEIKNCPCNVNFVNETNPLCATADTLEGVAQRGSLHYIPESKTPCVFVHKSGNSYELADVNTPQSSQWSFLNHQHSSQLYCLPSIFFPGVPKCGTTTLHYFLKQHQDIRIANTKGGLSFWIGGGLKESELFLDDNNYSRYNLFAYMSGSETIAESISSNIISKLKLGSDKNTLLDNTLIVDSSQGYFHQQKGLEKLTKFVPNPKCIFIMRDPLERVFSFFRYSSQIKSRDKIAWFKNQTPTGFHRYVTNNLNKYGTLAFHTSIYSIMVRKLFSMIPKEDIIFIQFEEFIKNPYSIIEEQVLPVIGLGPFDENIKTQIMNTTQHKNRSRHQFHMLPETRVLLTNHFREYNQELSVLLGEPKWTWGYQ